jgi:CyaY protein
MDERDFIAAADAELARIERSLESLLDDTGAGWDYEIGPGGVIELDFGDGGKIVINRHAAAREIWIAARSGGFHFRPPAGDGEPWCDTRAGENLDQVLLRCIGQQQSGAAGSPRSALRR